MVRPPTVTEVAPVVEAVLKPGEDVTVYLVMADPPVVVGADHETVALALPAVALTLVGALGGVAGP